MVTVDDNVVIGIEFLMGAAGDFSHGNQFGARGFEHASHGRVAGIFNGD